jgi:glycerophosphoryl diester phosphodiesterase
LTAEIVDEAHQHGFAVWAWTVDDPADMRRVTALGVDGIMTNRPDLLKTILVSSQTGVDAHTQRHPEGTRDPGAPRGYPRDRDIETKEIP